MKTIMLVHNSQAFLERNSSLLSRAGFLALTAISVHEALRVLQEQPVDLIISVLRMHGMGGDTLCSMVRKRWPARHLPFILVCYQSEVEFELASLCGADACLVKPVRPELLLTQIDEFLQIPPRRERARESATLLSGVQASQCHFLDLP